MINDIARKSINVDAPNNIPVATVKEYDDFVLKLALMKYNTPFDATGQTVSLGVKAPSGLYEQTTDITINKEQIDIKLKSGIVSKAGTCAMELKLVDADGSMTTASFFIAVNPKILGDEAVQASDEFESLVELKNEMQDMINSGGAGLSPSQAENVNKIPTLEQEIAKTNSQLADITQQFNTHVTNHPSGSGVNFRDVAEGETFILSGTTSSIYGEIVLSKTTTTIVEGQSDTFTVKLDKIPTNNQIVYLSKDNLDVTLNPTSLTFTPSNWNTAQTVTITVAEDNTDYSNESCTITVTSANVSSKTLIATITDNDTPPSNIPVTGVALDKTTHIFKTNESVQLVATIQPTDATNKAVTWTSSNTNIATVTSNGLVTAKAEGSATITVTTTDGSKTATCNLTVESNTIAYTNYLWNTDTYENLTNTSTPNYNQYWTPYKCTKTIENGIAKLLFNGSGGFFKCRPNINDSNIYYYRLLVRTTDVPYITLKHSDVATFTTAINLGEWSLYGIIKSDASTTAALTLTDIRTEGWTEIQTKEWMKINLTEIYGSGKEPDVNTCNTTFTQYVNGLKE